MGSYKIMKSIKKTFILLAIAMLIFSFVLATSYAANVTFNEKKDTGIIIESKSKTVSYKITWNANGGKIGNKNTATTSVKKGSKINKLATTPKLSEYTFKGWYTKKNGGTKISKNTKPTKSVIYYAQWTKKSPSLSATEKKLVGTWTNSTAGVGNRYSDTYNFKEDKTYSRVFTRTSYNIGNGRITGIYRSTYTGSWSVSGDTIHFTDRKYRTDAMDKDYWSSEPNSSLKIYNFGSDAQGQYFVMGDANKKYYKN